MSRRYYATEWADPRDERIKALENELDSAHQAIIDFSALKLDFDHWCWISAKSIAEFNEQRQALIDFVTDQAEGQANDRGWFGKRSPCPLCGGRPQQADGWLLPEGLRMHFEGDRTHQCSVFNAVKASNKRHLRKLYEEHEAAHARRLTVEPAIERDYERSNPELVETLTRSMTDEEQRSRIELVRRLGFEPQQRQNVTAYVRKPFDGEYCVLINPFDWSAAVCVYRVKVHPKTSQRTCSKIQSRGANSSMSWKGAAAKNGALQMQTMIDGIIGPHRAKVQAARERAAARKKG